MRVTGKLDPPSGLVEEDLIGSSRRQPRERAGWTSGAVMQRGANAALVLIKA
jgi:hypothetical protein